MQTLQSGEPDMHVGPLSRSRPRLNSGNGKAAAHESARPLRTARARSRGSRRPSSENPERVAMPDSSASYKKTETTADDKMKLAAEMPAWPGIRIVVAGKPDVLVQLQGLPASLVESIGNLNKPSSQWKSILKDVVPSLTSLAAVFISLAALIYTNHQKNVAETSAKDQREKAADGAKKKILGE